jgi:hypothetical protein
MYSDEDLDSAVAAGVLSAEAAAAFRAHVAGQRNTPAVDEEHFRLVTGFNDIFVVIASLLLLTSVGWIASTVTGWVGSLATAVTAWALSEFFVRKRRMALPAIVLLIAFCGNLFFAVFLPFKEFVDDPKGAIAAVAIASLVTVAATWLHWKRFHVPITVAAGAAALAASLIAMLLYWVPAAREWITPIIFAAGVAVFAAALWWDASDVKRETRRSDIAFWLHLLAAPLLVHPVFQVIGITSGKSDIAQALVAMALYVVIGLVSLAVDRRALMVSALGYVLYAFTALLKNNGVVSLDFALTALVIGSALLLLSAFWQTSRRFALGRLPVSITARLPPVRT